MNEGRGWQSKDVLTWIILIWGFSRVAASQEVPLGNPSCNFGSMTQAGLYPPDWLTGPPMTMEGEQ